MFFCWRGNDNLNIMIYFMARLVNQKLKATCPNFVWWFHMICDVLRCLLNPTVLPNLLFVRKNV